MVCPCYYLAIFHFSGGGGEIIIKSLLKDATYQLISHIKEDVDYDVNDFLQKSMPL